MHDHCGIKQIKSQKTIPLLVLGGPNSVMMVHMDPPGDSLTLQVPTI